jgi:hypothetical protein
MRLSITLTTALYPRGQFVQWTVLDATESGAYLFRLERSGSPEGPWALVMSDTPDQYAVRDLLTDGVTTDTYTPPNELTFYNNIFYKVTCKTPSGALLTDVAETGDRRLDRVTSRNHRKLQRDFRLSLKYNGTPYLLFKRRRWGVRCPRCYDAKTQRVVRADCRECWGTGFEEGYWKPTLTAGRRTVNANSTAITPEAKADSNEVRFWFPDFPTLERDDMLVSLKSQRRYRMDQQVDTELKLVGVHQVVTCQEIDKDHIFYRMPADPTTLNPLF